MRKLLSAVLAIAATIASAHAQSADEPQRIEVPDGVAAVRMPCLASEIRRKQEPGRFVVMCMHGGLNYALLDGGFPLKDDWSGDYDAVLADARADKSAGAITEREFRGMRSFSVEAPATEPFGLARIVEVRRGRLIGLVVQQAPDAANPAGLRERALAFVDTLEFFAK